ncbi:MAG: VanW family protein, partial [Candidatus Limnocylindrales bacterium]
MTTTGQTLTSARSRRLPRLGRRLLLFVGAWLVAVAAAAGGLAAFHANEAGRILPGVSAAGVELGGLTPDEARATLESDLSELSAGGIRIRSSVGSTSIAFADVGRVPDIGAMVAEAAALGRGGSWFDESIAAIRLRMEPVLVPLRLGYDHDRAAAAVTAFADRMALTAIDSSIVGGLAGFAVTGSVDGQRIDADQAIAAVDAAMRDPATRAGVSLEARIERVAPALSSGEAADARAAALRIAVPLTVKIGSNNWTIPADKIRSWISFATSDGAIRPVIDREQIPSVFKSIARKVARPVRDAEFLRDKRGRIVGSKADRAGRELDVAASVAAITAALDRRAVAPDTSPVKLAVATVAPKRSTEEAAKTAPLMVMVGGWTTRYQSSAHNGFSANITIPTRVLNGTVVQPGAVFDFWAGIGEVSLRTGYKLGGAIVGGHSVEGKALAGGICAASTTLFNAALRGGFEILRRQPHWYYITRYPLGLDATVSGSQTMRFRNDTAYPILIRGFASPGFVRYEIWSVPNGRTVSLSRPHVTNVVAGADSTVDAPDLATGTSERI